MAQFLIDFTKWKDVITTAVAITAIVTVAFQIRQSGAFERNRIRREQEAARSSLPLTLAALSEYGQDMITALAPLERWLEQGQKGPCPDFQQPRLYPETIAAVTRVVAAYPEKHIAQALAAILGEIQVLQSRSRDFEAAQGGILIWSIAMKENIILAASIIAAKTSSLSLVKTRTIRIRPDSI